MVGCPGGRSKFGEALDGCIGESGQDGGEVVAHRNAEPAAAFDDGEDCGHARSDLLAADVDPVGSAQGECPDILPMSVRN